MIVSLSINSDTGVPCTVALMHPAPRAVFVTKTNEKIHGYLGYDGDSDGHRKGFSVKDTALQHEPWCFAKTLYLPVHSFMAQSNNGSQYNHMVDIDKVMLVKGLLLNGDYHGFLVVTPSTDPRYRWWPVFTSI